MASRRRTPEARRSGGEDSAMERTFAIVEREMRRFRRSPTLIVMSLIMPIVQLLVLGYAFGGTVKHLKLGVVDQDRGMPAVRMRELASAVSSNAKTFEPVPYADLGAAVTALRNGRAERRARDSAGFFAARAREGRSARRAHRRQHRRLRRRHDGGDGERNDHRVRPAGGNDASRVAIDDARCRRGVSRTCRTSSICCPARS